MTEILKIKLVSPKMSLRPMDSEFKRLMSPSLSLATLAALTPEPHVVYIEDENLNPINFSDNPDIVGITVNVDTAYRAFAIAKVYRDRGIKVIFGGIHASSNPDSMSEHCDSVCIGEAEELWLSILDDLSAHILTPYPGTKIYHRFLQENRIIDSDLRKYNTSNVVFLPKNMTADELKDGYLKIYKDFYSFKNIIRRIPDNKKLIAPYFIFNFGYRKFGRLFSKIGKAGLMSKIGRLGSKLSYGLE